MFLFLDYIHVALNIAVFQYSVFYFTYILLVPSKIHVKCTLHSRETGCNVIRCLLDLWPHCSSTLNIVKKNDWCYIYLILEDIRWVHSVLLLLKSQCLISN